MPRRIITTEPTVEPVTATEAKAYANITHSSDDSLIESLIKAARKKCEQMCNRSFIDTSWTMYLDSFPPVIHLTPLPLDSITSVAYLDSTGASQTLTAVTDYRISNASDGFPPRLTPAYGTSWPSTYDVTDAVTIVYKVGYGAAASSVPDGIKTAIKMLVAHWYEYRTPGMAGAAVNSVPWTVEAILDPFRVPSLAGSLC